MKRSDSKEEKNVAAGGVLLKRSNSKEEQNVAEAKAKALQARHMALCSFLRLNSCTEENICMMISFVGPRPDEKVVEQTNPESETSESAYQNAAHQKSAMGQANRHRGPTVRLCFSTGTEFK